MFKVLLYMLTKYNIIGSIIINIFHILFTLRSFSGRYLHSFASSIHLSMSDILDSYRRKILIAPSLTYVCTEFVVNLYIFKNCFSGLISIKLSILIYFTHKTLDILFNKKWLFFIVLNTKLINLLWSKIKKDQFSFCSILSYYWS